MSETAVERSEWKPDVCLYHSPCTDGTAAAWAVWKRWGDAVQYVPVQYGTVLGIPYYEGKHVLMVDFSLKRPAMEAAAKLAKSIVVLDHHKTAAEELSPFPHLAPATLEIVTREAGRYRVLVQFDMEKSGARLAWEFCHPDKPMPVLLEHIEDRDLRGPGSKLPWTQEISKALHSYEGSFDRFDVWVTDRGVMHLITEGNPILRAHTKLVSELVANAYLSEVAGYTVPVLNVPGQYASDCGHELLQRYPDAPFAATWSRKADGKEAWSLRSEDSRVDVAAVAAAKGGGGHRNASGFSVSAERPLLRVEPDGRVVEVVS